MFTCQPILSCYFPAYCAQVLISWEGGQSLRPLPSLRSFFLPSPPASRLRSLPFRLALITVDYWMWSLRCESAAFLFVDYIRWLGTAFLTFSGAFSTVTARSDIWNIGMSITGRILQPDVTSPSFKASHSRAIQQRFQAREVTLVDRLYIHVDSFSRTPLLDLTLD